MWASIPFLSKPPCPKVRHLSPTIPPPKYVREKKKPVTPPHRMLDVLKFHYLSTPQQSTFLSLAAHSKACQVSFHFHDLIPATGQWNTPLKETALRGGTSGRGRGRHEPQSTLGIFPTETNPVKPRKASRSKLSRSPRKKQFAQN